MKMTEPGLFQLGISLETARHKQEKDAVRCVSQTCILIVQMAFFGSRFCSST